MVWQSRALGSIDWARWLVVVVVSGRTGMGRDRQWSLVERLVYAESDRFGVATNGLGVRSDGWAWWAIVSLRAVRLEAVIGAGRV